MQVSIDEIRTHNRDLAQGYVAWWPNVELNANLCSLLMSPFEYTEAFNKALKNVIKTLPNRPARETAEDVVSRPYTRTVLQEFPNKHRSHTTAHSSAPSARMLATREHSARLTSIAWCPLKASSRNARLFDQRLFRVYTTARRRTNSLQGSTGIRL